MPAVGKSFRIWGEKSGSWKNTGEGIPLIYFILCHSFSFLNLVLHQRLVSSASKSSEVHKLLVWGSSRSEAGTDGGTQYEREVSDPLQSHTI